MVGDPRTGSERQKVIARHIVLSVRTDQGDGRLVPDTDIEALFSHSTKDAIFYADKLITLTNGHPVLLYLLGECYYQNQDFKKVHSLFQKYDMLNFNQDFQILAARALVSVLKL